MPAELLFTAGFTYPEGDGILLTGYSPSDDMRLPVAGEWLEIRSPGGGRVRARALRVARNFSVQSPVFPRPLDRAVVFSGGDVPQRNWGRSEVWSCEPDAEPGAAAARPRD
jgi:hypothetical protein